MYTNRSLEIVSCIFFGVFIATSSLACSENSDLEMLLSLVPEKYEVLDPDVSQGEPILRFSYSELDGDKNDSGRFEFGSISIGEISLIDYLFAYSGDFVPPVCNDICKVVIREYGDEDSPRIHSVWVKGNYFLHYVGHVSVAPRVKGVRVIFPQL